MTRLPLFLMPFKLSTSIKPFPFLPYLTIPVSRQETTEVGYALLNLTALVRITYQDALAAHLHQMTGRYPDE